MNPQAAKVVCAPAPSSSSSSSSDIDLGLEDGLLCNWAARESFILDSIAVALVVVGEDDEERAGEGSGTRTARCCVVGDGKNMDMGGVVLSLIAAAGIMSLSLGGGVRGSG